MQGLNFIYYYGFKFEVTIILSLLCFFILLNFDKKDIAHKIESIYQEKFHLYSEIDIRDIQNYYDEKESIEDFKRKSKIWFQDIDEIKSSPSFDDFKFIKEAIINVENVINTLNGISKTNSPYNTSEHNKTFNFKVPKDYSNKLKNSDLAKSLYKSLTENEVIIGSETDFINAFTNKIIKSGIIWTVKSNKKLTSKPTLLYFLQELKSKGFISRYNDYKKIEYIFRDCNGEKLKNLNKVNLHSNIQNLENVDLALEDFYNSLKN